MVALMMVVSSRRVRSGLVRGVATFMAAMLEEEHARDGTDGRFGHTVVQPDMLGFRSLSEPMTAPLKDELIGWALGRSID
eukprot:179652-Amphidinium_carterae.1